MEEQTPSTSSSNERLQDIAQSLDDSRARAREVLSAQREDLDKLESGLSEHIRMIAQELANDRSELDSQKNDLRDQAILLKQQEEKLRTGQQGWEDLEKEVRHQQEEMAKFLQQKQDELDQREQQLSDQDALSQSIREEAKAAEDQARQTQEEVDEQEQTLQRAQQRIEQKEQALDQKLDEADQKQIQTKSQRRRIASDLKQQRLELAREREEVERLRNTENEEYVSQTVELARLREELQTSSEQVEQLQQDLTSGLETQKVKSEEIDALRGENQSLQTALDSLHEERNAIHQHQENATSDLEEMRAQFDALAQERNSLAGEIELLRSSGDENHVRQAAEMSRLEDDLRAAGEAYERLERDCAAERDSWASKSEAFEALRSEMETLQSECSTLHDQRNTVQKQCESVTADLDQLRTVYEASLQQRDKLDRQVEQLRESGDHDQARLAAEMSRLKEDLQVASDAYDQLQQELTAERESQLAKSEELEVLRVEKEALQVDCDRLQDHHGTIQKQYESITADFQQLRAEYDASVQERDKLGSEVEQLRTSGDQDQDRQAAEMSRLKEELQAAGVACEQLQQDLNIECGARQAERDAQATLQAEKDALLAEYNSQLEEREALEKRCEDAGEELKALRDEYGAVSKDRDRLAAEIDQLRKHDGEDHARQASEISRLKEDLLTAREDCQRLRQDMTAEHELQKSLSETHDALRTEKEALLAERNTLQEERNSLSDQHEQVCADLEALRVEQRASSEEQERLASELNHAQTQLQAAQAGSVDAEELKQARQKCELALEDTRQLKQRNSELEEELARRPAGDGVSEAELAAVCAERDTLIERLAEAEIKANQPENDSQGQQKMQDLQRRFEMAVEDVRELKMLNSDLKEELAAAKASQDTATPVAPASGGNLDWEAQKNQLLASLEDDFDDEDEDDHQDKLTIEGTIHITDEIVADKEREIQELKRLLDDQSSNLGDVAVGAAAIAGMLDQDELICEERERLAQVQEEWKEKLRTAEIDLSVERAKMARERTELEARAEALEKEIAEKVEAALQGGGDPQSKPKGGNWLKRLGLKDSEG